MKHMHTLMCLLIVSCQSKDTSVAITPNEGVYLLTSVGLDDGCNGRIGDPLEVNDTKEATIFVNEPELTIDMTNCTWDGAIATCNDTDVMMQGNFEGSQPWLSVSAEQEWRFADEQEGEATLYFTYDCSDSDCPHLQAGIDMDVPCTVTESVAFVWSRASN